MLAGPLEFLQMGHVHLHLLLHTVFVDLDGEVRGMDLVVTRLMGGEFHLAE